MESHWENSSNNSIIKDMIEGATEVTKAEIETLISGRCVEKPIIRSEERRVGKECM